MALPPLNPPTPLAAARGGESTSGPLAKLGIYRQETLNARSEYTNDDRDGTKLRINQYLIREEIGRGSYGAVHLATDQFGNEYVGLPHV